MFRTASLAATLITSAFCVAPVAAQSSQSTEQSLQWAEYRVVFENNPARLASGRPGQASVRTVNGAEVLTVTRTTAMLEGVDFSEGVIEFDLALDNKRGSADCCGMRTDRTQSISICASANRDCLTLGNTRQFATT